MTLIKKCECGIFISAADDQSGREVFCPKCQKQTRLPETPTVMSWQSEGWLVVLRRGELPNKCFRCSEETNTRPAKKALLSNNAAEGLVLPATLARPWNTFAENLIGTRRIIRFRLCGACSRKRFFVQLLCTFAITFSIVGIVGGFFAFILWVALHPAGGRIVDPAFIAVMVVASLLYVGGRYYSSKAEPFVDAYSQGEYTWFRGVHPRVLAELPQWTGEIEL